MIENVLCQWVTELGALGIVAFVVWNQQMKTNKLLDKLQSTLERNTHVIEYFMKRGK